MDEETTGVGNPGSAAGDSQSSGAGGQQSVDLAAIQSKLTELEKLYRGLQKGTDKINARVEERVGEILSPDRIGRIAELAKAGKNSAEIENQLLLEDLLAERKGRASGAAGGNPGGAGGGSEGTNILKGFAAAFGLDANDATVADALSKNDIAALANIAKAKLTVPDPDGSTQPPLTHKQPAPNKAKEIEDGYRAEMAKVPRGNTHMVSTVRAKWRRVAKENGLQLNV